MRKVTASPAVIVGVPDTFVPLTAYTLLTTAPLTSVTEAVLVSVTVLAVGASVA